MALWTKVDRQVAGYLQKEFQPQAQNRFKFIIVQTPGINPLTWLSTATGVGVSVFYCRGGSFPVSNEYTWESYGENKYIKDIVFPEGISAQFYEDEDGTVIRYFNEWQREIESGGWLNDLGILPRDGDDTEFEYDQERAKRTGMLMMQRGTDKTSLYPRIMYYGLGLKKLDDIVVGHDEEGILTYTVNFSVDDITIAGLI